MFITTFLREGQDFPGIFLNKMRASLNPNYVKEMSSGSLSIQTISESRWGDP